MPSLEENISPTDAAAAGMSAAPCDLLVVASPAWLAEIKPPWETPNEHLAERYHATGEGRLLVAPLAPDRDRSLHPGRLTHLALRACALDVARLIAMTSDGQAVASVVNVPEAQGSLLDDAGSAAAVARLAAALDLAPSGWPTTDEGRFGILLDLLEVIGVPLDAGARVPRLAAYALALHAGPTSLPVPPLLGEMEIQARMAGLGARTDPSSLVDTNGLPTLLSAAEGTALSDKASVVRLFREAASTLVRLRVVAARFLTNEGDAAPPQG